MSVSSRKKDHVRICIEKNVNASKNYFNYVKLFHNCLPERNLKDIDTRTSFLGKELRAPIIISSITGGTRAAKRINKNLAKAAQKLGLGMGVGSQRIAIEKPGLASTFKVRDVAPDIFLYANIGAIQLNYGFNKEELKKAVEMIGADALALHLNALQEAVQPEGETNFKGVLKKIREVARQLSFPLIAKETGAGIGYWEACKLAKSGISAFMVDGLGGTSFSLVEHYRKGSKSGFVFADWGVPTPASIIYCKKTGLPVVSGGGVRNGLDAAKSIALGASASQVAGVLLPFAIKSAAACEKKLKEIIQELKIAMFLTGSSDIAELSKARHVITGELRDWLDVQRIYK